MISEHRSHIDLENLRVDIPGPNPHSLLIIGDFNNVKFGNWSFNNIKITESTNTLKHSSSCIDLMFINQPKTVRDSGIHSISQALLRTLEYIQSYIQSIINRSSTQNPVWKLNMLLYTFAKIWEQSRNFVTKNL